jgi:hypothetical protein
MVSLHLPLESCRTQQKGATKENSKLILLEVWIFELLM